MEYEFYADVFFLSNFYMDFLAIYTVNELLGGKRRIRRFLLGCGVGSLTGLLLFLYISNYSMYLLFIHFLLNPALVIFCFVPTTKKILFKAWFLMYFILLLLGGSVEWMYQTLLNQKYYEICLLLSAVPILILLSILRQKRKSVQLLYSVIIQNKENSAEIRAYFDTGNRLIDPYVGLPVQVISKKIAMQLLKEESFLPRLIPYTSVGSPQGMIEAITVEKVQIVNGKEEIVFAPAVLALAEDDIFQGRDYSMILNCAWERELNPEHEKNNKKKNGEQRCT